MTTTHPNAVLGGPGEGPGGGGRAPAAGPRGPQAAGESLPAPRGASYHEFIAEIMAALEAAEAQAEADARELVAEDLRAAATRFWPDTDEKVAWLGRLFLELQAEQERVKASAKAKLAKLDFEMRRLAAAFDVPLRDWLDGEIGAAPGKKKPRSARFWGGLFGYRTVPGGPRVADKAAATKWAEENDNLAKPSFGKLEYVLDQRKLVAHVKAVGEAIPGIEVREPREAFYVVSDLKTDTGRKAMKQLVLSDLAALALPEPEADDADEHEPTPEEGAQDR